LFLERAAFSRPHYIPDERRIYMQEFSAEIARRYGVVAAVLAEYIWREVKQNKYHKKHAYEGRVWMRSSKLMFTAAMPYLSKSVVNRGLQKLIKHGVIIKREFNQSRFDRTSWYSFTAFGEKLMEESEGENYA